MCFSLVLELEINALDFKLKEYAMRQLQDYISIVVQIQHISELLLNLRSTLVHLS